MPASPLQRKTRVAEWRMAGAFILALLSIGISWSYVGTWLTESVGVSTVGQVVDISECIGRYDPAGSARLEVSFVDLQGYGRLADSRCETDAQAHQVGQQVTVRYLPFALWFILIPEDIGRNDGLVLLTSLIADAILVPLVVVFARNYKRRRDQAIRSWATLRVLSGGWSPSNLSRSSRSRTNPAFTRRARRGGSRRPRV